MLLILLFLFIVFVSFTAAIPRYAIVRFQDNTATWVDITDTGCYSNNLPFTSFNEVYNAFTISITSQIVDHMKSIPERDLIAQQEFSSLGGSTVSASFEDIREASMVMGAEGIAFQMGMRADNPVTGTPVNPSDPGVSTILLSAYGNIGIGGGRNYNMNVYEGLSVPSWYAAHDSIQGTNHIITLGSWYFDLPLAAKTTFSQTSFILLCDPSATIPSPSPTGVSQPLLTVPLQESISCMKKTNSSKGLVTDVTNVVVSQDLSVIVEGHVQTSNLANILNTHLLKVRWVIGRKSYRQTAFLNSTELQYPSNPNDMVQFRASFPKFFPNTTDFSGYLKTKVILTDWQIKKKAKCLKWKRKA